MDVPTLILLGAVGGVLRGAFDCYIQFANWRSARNAHQREQLAEHERPRLTQYFDPAVDLAAAGVHSVMGAGMAVLFGTTGQISGPYAAIVVGASAPVLLTQLARIQSVSEALGGGPASAGPADSSAVVGAGPADPAAAMAAVPADPAQRPIPPLAQPVLSEQGAAVLDAPHAAAALQADTETGPPRRTSPQLRSAAFRQDTDATQQPSGRPGDPGHGLGGRQIPPLRGERAVGEEGSP
ncbi:hypothetical protein [Streptomyces sp. Tu102]|uniref:hypothetical protein n=1 Tax=Streptomyces TaxID=1883 RepID=UPI001BDC62C7|nr:hypothetical protein [Streptomyces sp. Tu102]MBT1094196.1 hypothetical protein [Streptomyces sp. Tu102]